MSPAKNPIIGDLDNPKIVIIGGGGGTAAVYPEIVAHTPNTTAILGTFDSGGSTGRISKELNIAAVGDLRRVMMAASNNKTIRQLQTQRFTNGDFLRGQTFGNMIVAGCVDLHGMDKGIQMACEVLQVPGTILPVTLERAELVMQDGLKIVRDEHVIDEYSPITLNPRISLDPLPTISEKAEAAIRQADLIIVAAGSVYTSQLAVLGVGGVVSALKSAKAPKVMLANLATEKHQTEGWHVADYVMALQRHNVYPDFVLYNNKPPTEEMLKNYQSEGESPVDYSPERFSDIPDVYPIGAAILSDAEYSRDPNDPVAKRGLMRHDSAAVWEQIQAIPVRQKNKVSV